MNDFTKDELKIINHAVYYLDTGWHGGCKEISELLTKTQSMIDNYCEHEWEITDYRHDRCIKCGVVN